jgi:hypothetical protein
MGTIAIAVIVKLSLRLINYYYNYVWRSECTDRPTFS